MKKFKSFFGKIRNKNIVFIIGFLLCLGVIFLIAFGINGSKIEVVQPDEASRTTSRTTVEWNTTGPEQYEIDLDSIAFKTTAKAPKTSKLNKKSKTSSTKKSKATSKKTNKAKKTTQKSASKKTNKAKKTTVTTAKKIKKSTRKKAVTTTSKKIKTTQATTKKKTTTTKKKTSTTKKKTSTTTAKKKKTATTTKATKIKAIKAVTAKKSDGYKTRDISKETYTIKNVITGKKLKSNGFDILCQIVNGEMDSSWNEEALKAQAVAAYTYLRYCRVNGITPELGAKSGYNSKIEKAVKSVQGLVCTYNGSVISAVFCASTAGCTADCANVWEGNYPYLKSVYSKYDEAYDPNYGITKTMSKKDVKKILKKQGVTLSTKKKNWIKAISHFNGKYVGYVSIDGKLTLTGDKVRSLFGLRSSAFTVSYSDGYFTFTTYGYGHGVGMSQWGAQFYASKGGYKFDQILKRYYSGIKISL